LKKKGSVGYFEGKELGFEAKESYPTSEKERENLRR